MINQSGHNTEVGAQKQTFGVSEQDHASNIAYLGI